MATGSNDKEAMTDEENKSDDEAEENMPKLETMKAKKIKHVETRDDKSEKD